MYGASIAIWALSNSSLIGKMPHETRVKVIVGTCIVVKVSAFVVKCLFQDQIVVNPEELHLVATVHENPSEPLTMSGEPIPPGHLFHTWKCLARDLF